MHTKNEQQSHSVQSCWQAKEKPRVLTKIVIGQTHIILYDGGQGGFLEGALLIFNRGQKSSDYHRSLKCESFVNGQK